jgi:ribosomal protein S18
MIFLFRIFRGTFLFYPYILPRRMTKLNAKQHRRVIKAIKQARIFGLLPFINKENL